ncbi:apolipophorins-like isoform X2 [Daktulosphaira vitifoliae]|uniref:apolipophorins-like isoform X2 n=1 Tax=Daktulosphaira vitifoliae TaxID=58002 RepID=UPI0021A9C102|nr:apolipophorins-like isoform X2 [Daktulosphaira vitifoliae]
MQRLPLATLVLILTLRITFSLEFKNEDETVCTSVCNEGADTVTYVHFEPNKIYYYDFDGKTTIVTPTNSQYNSSTIVIKGKVQIMGVDNCGAILNLSDIEIQEGMKMYSNTDLEGSPVLFSYNNGIISPNICTSDNEKTSSLNIKRGIISALQISLSHDIDSESILETDILGTCSTKYTYSTISGKSMVTKEKDFTKCTEHETVFISDWSKLRPTTNYKNSPFSKAQQNAKIIIDDFSIYSVSSNEIYNYQPFGQIGSTTFITANTRLILQQKNYITAGEINLPTVSRSLIFEKPTPNIELINEALLVKVAEEASENVEPVISYNGSRTFTHLVTLLKDSTKEEILAAFSQLKSSTRVKNSKVIRSIFVEALILTNSGSSIEAVATLVKRNEISDMMAASWFIRLGNVNNPTLSSIVIVSDLLNGRVQKEAYLGIGCMIRKYLAYTNQYDKPEIDQALKNLAGPLAQAGQINISAKDEDLAIASLKGIGNIQYMSEDLTKYIAMLIVGDQVKPRIKAAALDMVKTYAQNPLIQEACKIIFINKIKDSELRIKAFLVFALYPTSNKASIIKNVLESKDSINQLRTYIMSYLNNLQSTNDAQKLDQKSIYGRIQYESKNKSFNDVLRFSQNFEFSQKCSMFNSKFIANGDVLYSQKSFVPRSTSFTLKTTIFGHSYDVLEISYRGDNMERILESVDEPIRYFSKKTADLLKDATKYNNVKVLNEKSKYREVSSEESSEKSDEPVNIDLVLKVMGSDISWFTFHGLKNQVTYQSLIDELNKHFDDTLETAKDIDFNIRKFIPILDNDLTYATMTGFPINMKIQANSIIKFNMNANIFMKDYIENPQNSKFALQFIPSGSVDFNTMLSVDGYVVEVGNKISSSAHTSSGSNFFLRTVKGRGIEMVVGLPLPEMDLLTFESEAFATLQELGEPLQYKSFSTDVRKQSFSRNFEKFGKLAGLSLYVDYSFSWNSNFKLISPYNGRISMSVKLRKFDQSLTNYVLQASYNNVLINRRSVKITFSTPNSDINRDIEFAMGYDMLKKTKIIAHLLTSSKKIIFTGEFVNKNEEKSIEIKYLSDSEHTLALGIKGEQFDENKISYSPIFKVEYKDKFNSEPKSYLPNLNIEGNVIIEHNTTSCYKITLEDLAVVVSKFRPSLKGSIILEGDEFNMNTQVSLVTHNITTKIMAQISNPFYKLHVNFDVVQNSKSTQLLNNVESRSIALGSPIKKLKMSFSYLLRIAEPYNIKSKNYIEWNDFNGEINGRLSKKNKNFSLDGDVYVVNLLNHQVNGKFQIKSRNQNSGATVLGFIYHIHDSNPEDKNYISVSFIEDSNNKSGEFEFNLQCPSVFGVYKINSDYEVKDDSFKFNVNGTIQDETRFKANIKLQPRNVYIDISHNSFGNNTIIFVQYLSKSSKSTEFQTKILWPGSEDTNYFISTGEISLDVLRGKLNGFLDCPAMSLKNVQIKIKSEPNNGSDTDGLAVFELTSNENILYSGKLEYTISIKKYSIILKGDGNINISQNRNLSATLGFVFKDYNDKNKNNGKEISYILIMPHTNTKEKRSYQRTLKISKQMISYEQLYQKGDQKQIIIFDFEHNFKNLGDFSYKLTSEVNTPSIFHMLLDNNQNKAELTSSMIVKNNMLDKKHLIKIYSGENIDYEYEMKLMINSAKAGFKLLRGQREITAALQYNMKPTVKGYMGTLSGILWLDRLRKPYSRSTMSLDGQYSLQRGLFGGGQLRLTSPAFGSKEISVLTNTEILTNWKNPLNISLDLNIFPKEDQRIKINSVLIRTNESEGIKYSGVFSAQSTGMKMDYVLNETLIVTPTRWGNHLGGYFIDYNNIKRPIFVYCELISGKLLNELNIFDIIYLNVDLSYDINDNVLKAKSDIVYNEHPYKFGVVLSTTPRINYLMQWNDRSGSPERLIIDGRATIDDSAILSAIYLKLGKKEKYPVGYIKKFLNEENWMQTDNHLNRNQVADITKSLKGEIIERVVTLHNNMNNIVTLVKNQYAYHQTRSRNISPYSKLATRYINDQYSTIKREFTEDHYLCSAPTLSMRVVRALSFDFIDFLKLESVIDALSEKIEKTTTYLDETYKNTINDLQKKYSMLVGSLNNKINDLESNIENNVPEIREYKNLGYSLKSNNTGSSLNLIFNGIKKRMKIVEESSFHKILLERIEKLSKSPVVEKIWKSLHKYLLGLKDSVHSKDMADLMSAVDSYLDKVVHDGFKNTKDDLVQIKDKFVATVRYMIVYYPEYITYHRVMAAVHMINSTEISLKSIYNSINTLPNSLKSKITKLDNDEIPEESIKSIYS